MDRGGRGEGPALGLFAPDDFGNVVGQLLANPAVVLGFERGSFRDRIGVAAIAIADREPARATGPLMIA